MTRLPILLATTILQERRREWETLRRQRIARESLAEQRRTQKLAKARARDEQRTVAREPAGVDVIVDVTDRAATRKAKEYAHS